MPEGHQLFKKAVADELQKTLETVPARRHHLRIVACIYSFMASSYISSSGSSYQPISIIFSSSYMK